MTIALVKVSCINDRLIPLGLACLQAFLKQNSISVKVFNFRTLNFTLPKVVFDPLIQLNLTDFIVNHQDLPLLIPITNDILNNKEINLSEGVYPDILKDYSSRMFETPETSSKRFQSMIDYCKDTVLDSLKDFDTIGFSLNYLNISETIISSCYQKLHNPECKIIWGGPSITQSFDAYKNFLHKGVCDGLVIGEGEKPLLDIALGKALKEIKGVMSINEKGLIQYINGEPIDLDLLPTPDYTDIPLDTYYQIASIYRSRGCTNRCKFCAEWKLFGSRFRTRSVEKVVRDIEKIVKNHKPGFMLFGESLINDDLDYFEELCDALIKKNLGIKFGTHFRANITPGLAKKAKLAGFEDAWVGFEAFSDEELKEMNKGTNVHQNMETIEILTQAGVNVIAMLVVGFSDLSTEQKNCENIIKTIDYYSNKNRKSENCNQTQLSLQFRPAPMYLVPGSFDYQDKMCSCTKPWKCNSATNQNRREIKKLEDELSTIPYSFERPIPNQKIAQLIQLIQDTDRKAGFTIGGVTKYVIDYTMEERRKNRKARKAQRIGVSAQRLEKDIDLQI
ncbi:MAG: B12-binding domain-containing radical SAM protein [Candidatus Lokiarchaeota archaeon]|nr:B12-binding domain-containing radical SAM protein [Candidatus Lokiarchaeota archaeon]